jgi:hypothetical protein
MQKTPAFWKRWQFWTIVIIFLTLNALAGFSHTGIIIVDLILFAALLWSLDIKKKKR